jgi:hypothetical protein
MTACKHLTRKTTLSVFFAVEFLQAVIFPEEFLQIFFKTSSDRKFTNRFCFPALLF